MKQLLRNLLLAASFAAATLSFAAVTTDWMKTGTLAGARALCSSAVAVSGAADTNENTLATCTVPGGSMGVNGQLRVTALWTVNNNANAKTVRIRFGGASGTAYSAIGLASLVSRLDIRVIANTGAANSQVGGQSGSDTYASTANALTTSAVDTSASTTIVFTCQKATAGDTCTLSGYTVELFPG